MTLAACFEAFNNMRVLVIGDVMVDAYMYGKVDRISPEAPVPVVNVTKPQENRLGGAANVALNVKALGAHPIMCSVIGEDQAGDQFMQRCAANGLPTEGILRVPNRPTTIKTRIISGQQQILRVDQEITADIDDDTASRLIQKVKDLLASEQVDVIIFEDYDKGLLTPKVIQEVIALAKAQDILTAVDPKKAHFFDYVGVTLFKPNLKELKDGLQQQVDPTSMEALTNAAQQLQDKLQNALTLITLSEHGVFLHADAQNHHHHPAMEVDIADVSGAGDTVISVAALCLAAGLDHARIAALVNVAGGQVVEKAGVVAVNKSVLLADAQQRLG